MTTLPVNIHPDAKTITLACDVWGPANFAGGIILVIGSSSVKLNIPESRKFKTISKVEVDAHPGENPATATRWACAFWLRSDLPGLSCKPNIICETKEGTTKINYISGTF